MLLIDVSLYDYGGGKLSVKVYKNKLTGVEIMCQTEGERDIIGIWVFQERNTRKRGMAIIPTRLHPCQDGMTNSFSIKKVWVWTPMVFYEGKEGLDLNEEDVTNEWRRDTLV